MNEQMMVAMLRVIKTESFLEEWFKQIGWVLSASGVVALGVYGQSKLLMAVGFMSFCAILLRVIIRLVKYSHQWSGDDENSSKNVFVALSVLLILAVLMSEGLISVIASIGAVPVCG